MSHTKRFRAGDTLMKEGDTSDEFYLIREGRVRVKKKDKWIGDLKTGDIVGEMGLIDRKPRSATVVAMDETTVSVMAREELEEKLKREPMINHLVRSLIKRLREADRRLTRDD